MFLMELKSVLLVITEEWSPICVQLVTWIPKLMSFSSAQRKKSAQHYQTLSNQSSWIKVKVKLYICVTFDNFEKLTTARARSGLTTDTEWRHFKCNHHNMSLETKQQTEQQTHSTKDLQQKPKQLPSQIPQHEHFLGSRNAKISIGTHQILVSDFMCPKSLQILVLKSPMMLIRSGRSARTMFHVLCFPREQCFM